MRSIALVARKGGTGKSTIAVHLAVEAARSGRQSVAIVDLDPQGSAAGWRNAREAEQPLFATTSTRALPKRLELLEVYGIDLVFIDTPPGLDDPVQAAAKAADLVLIPCRPSVLDLSAIGPTVELVEKHGKPHLFILNAATARSRLESQALTALSVAAPVIHQRTVFAAAMTDGRTAGELEPGSKAAEEITKLWRYVSTQLRKYGKEK